MNRGGDGGGGIRRMAAFQLWPHLYAPARLPSPIICLFADSVNRVPVADGNLLLLRA